MENIETTKKSLSDAIRDLNEGRNMKWYRKVKEWPDAVCPYCGKKHFVTTPANGEVGDKHVFATKCSCGRELKIAVSLIEIEGEVGGCWGLCSFGWKDADLDPEGCTGIDKIVSIDEEKIVVNVGGHKTATDPTYETPYNLTKKDKDYYSEAAYEIVCGCGYEGYWSGDDWSLSVRKEVPVEWVKTEDGDFDISSTAEKIVELAKVALAPYESEMKTLSEMLDELYDEIYRKYEPVATRNKEKNNA